MLQEVQPTGGEELLLLRPGKDTMLIVLGQSQVRHEGRNQYMEDQAMKMKSHPSTGNGVLGKIVIDTFADEQELAARMSQQLFSGTRAG